MRYEDRKCPRLLNRHHGPGPGGPGIRPYDTVHECLGVKGHPGKHQFDQRVYRIVRG